MSFQSLISGAECNVASNPLAQVLKHTEGDRSLQQLRQLPGTTSAPNEHDLALARQFFEANPHHQQRFLGPAPFSLPAEAHSTQGSVPVGPSGPDLNEAWLMKQQNHSSLAGPSQWAAEFNGPIDSSVLVQNAGQQQSIPMQAASQIPTHFPQSGLHGPRPPMWMYGSSPNTMTNYALRDENKGKGKSRQVDFEAAFDQIAAYLATTQPTTSRLQEVKDDVHELETAMENTTLGSDSFKDLWEELQKSDMPPPSEDKAKWEAEFNQLMSSQRDELDYGAHMQEAWESGLGDFSDHNQLSEKPIQFDDEGVPILDDYVFEKKNQYLDPSSPAAGSLLQNAKALLEANGSLSEIALMLEAAIQKGELGEGGYEAWILLGEVRAMDEREDAGMRAMMRGVKLSEAAGAPGPGMLSLAISFTNESYDRGSHSMLLRWLRARYPEQPVPDETLRAMKTNSAWDTHGRLTELFLNLARIQHNQGTLDPDVQVALGVLFYNQGEYDRAKDCFEAALSVHPRDYILWNRLGSTLSNGMKPEEALGAYREALSLRPTYTRAIYNVGVACLNIGAHKEAAEHFLGALNLQDAINGDTSEQLWFTLRRAFLAMERPDLAEIAKPGARDNLDAFRREGFDF
ncbi:hypothetical protein AMATHDRAFT_136767 [Amanita thiersii Skay4041]|uniref:Uncharacterized protein n=1 Tax=Amanita thiersii Skay4041 TaxID=703135 RepID=A0A2A9NWN9_9AGAR|nr:hypothetical protein AMATHDRAFT_136767 [Amanita thiersii Skay4041]